MKSSGIDGGNWQILLKICVSFLVPLKSVQVLRQCLFGFHYAQFAQFFLQIWQSPRNQQFLVTILISLDYCQSPRNQQFLVTILISLDSCQWSLDQNKKQLIDTQSLLALSSGLTSFINFIILTSYLYPESSEVDFAPIENALEFEF